MELSVRQLALKYETLANRAIKLNQSYLSLLKLYDELNLDSRLFLELANSAYPPVNVIESMQKDQQILQDEFDSCANLAAKAQADFTEEADVVELQAITHDCQVMRNFAVRINLENLKKMFGQLIQR